MFYLFDFIFLNPDTEELKLLKLSLYFWKPSLYFMETF